jgi:hypothetical protein
MKPQMTIGKKLGISFSVMLALTMGLGFVAWTAVSSLGQQLDQAINRTAVKLDLAQAVGKRVQELAASSR